MPIADPRNRLLALADARGVSLAALSALIGRNASYLQQFVRKGSPRKLDEADRRKLARFFGVDEAELGGGQEISHGPGRWVDVARLALDASAGPGAVPQGEAAVGILRFSAAWLRAQGLDPAQVAAMAVAGDSMEPTLRDGDEILVDRRRRPLRDGVYVLRRGDSLLVKRVAASGAGRLLLISDNPAYPPIDLPAGEVVPIGRVVWKGGRL
ncbi:MAG TPA: LexA family transcriptional regulator [Novosphingobium sp.]|nr:LexA family transcriptional regulator [Novosphingobium sp.]HZV08235.1 LexA family transcriptional regulator [Novosphingobium sp.]